MNKYFGFLFLGWRKGILIFLYFPCIIIEGWVTLLISRIFNITFIKTSSDILYSCLTFTMTNKQWYQDNSKIPQDFIIDCKRVLQPRYTRQPLDNKPSYQVTLCWNGIRLQLHAYNFIDGTWFWSQRAKSNCYDFSFRNDSQLSSHIRLNMSEFPRCKSKSAGPRGLWGPITDRFETNLGKWWAVMAQQVGKSRKIPL